MQFLLALLLPLTTSLAIVALLAPTCGIYWLFLWTYLALVAQFASACMLYWHLGLGYPDPCSFHGSCLYDPLAFHCPLFWLSIGAWGSFLWLYCIFHVDSTGSSLWALLALVCSTGSCRLYCCKRPNQYMGRLHLTATSFSLNSRSNFYPIFGANTIMQHPSLDIHRQHSPYGIISLP